MKLCEAAAEAAYTSGVLFKKKKKNMSYLACVVQQSGCSVEASSPRVHLFEAFYIAICGGFYSGADSVAP